jgi:7-carboxy-7-deazaguanine synthase
MNKVIPIVTQNVDRIVRRRDYEQFGDRLLVTSMFRTIQGEGPYAGHPAVFLRLAGCNFGDKQDHCSWCDTSFQFDEGTAYTHTDLLAALQALPGYRNTDILVITGGEPTLQPALVSFLRLMSFTNWRRVQLETNGTQAAFFEQLEQWINGDNEPAVCWAPSIVISPKASSKAGRIPELSKLALKYASCLKFVVSSDPNDPQHTIPDWALQSRKKVYVSPMAVYARPYAGEVSSIWEDGLVNKEATAANYAYAAQYAMAHGLLLSLQTHLFTAIP